MPSLPNAAQLTALAILLAPGLIILGLRSRFREAASPPLKDRVIAFAVASAAYYAAATPVFHVDGGVSLEPWLWQLLFYFVVPAALGAVVIWIDHAEWFYRLSGRLGLGVAHHIPAAWDYAFSRTRTGAYIWVKLNDGTEYAGVFGKGSFASSSTAERDLYIEEVWKVEENQAWTQLLPPRSVLLCGKDIRCVEIFSRS